MTRHSLLLSLLSLFALLACDPKPAAPPQPPSAESPAAVKAPEPPAERLTPLLWEIEGPNGPVYIFGTIHIGVDIDSPGYEVVRERFDKSTMFVMETDLTDAREDMAKDMAIPADQPDIEQQLGPEAWKALDMRLGGAATSFKRMQPWVIVSMVINKMIADLKAATPMDQELSDRARAAKMELGFLEPASLQLELLKKHLNVEELKEMVLDFDTQKADLGVLVKAYKEADIEGLTTSSFKDKDRKPEMYEDMFYKRNRSWIPHIKTYIERGNVFVAFGAGHLVGDKGVLALLEAEGIKVKPIR
jgi:uncharacterized protein